MQLPLPSEEGLPCIVKVYDADTMSFPVNQVYDFVGVLAIDASRTSFQQGATDMDVDDAFLEEHLAHDPPTSVVPRLHAICFRPVAPGAPVLPCGAFRAPQTHVQALHAEAAARKAGTAIDPSLLSYPSSHEQAQRVLAELARAQANAASASASPGSSASASGDIEATRAQVVALLTSALGGDKLAAEYLLLNLISRVYARVDGMPLGVMSLALSHAGGVGTPQQPQLSSTEGDLAPAVTALCALMAQLVPSSAKLSLSIASLNERYWSPRKDMTANRLISGPLQLAKSQGTCLLLDESAMQQGRLNDHGCRNLRALQTLVESQTGECFLGGGLGRVGAGGGAAARWWWLWLLWLLWLCGGVFSCLFPSSRSSSFFFLV